MTQVQLTIRSSGHCFAEGHHVMKGAPKTPVRFEAIWAEIDHPTQGKILYDTGYTWRFLDATQRFPQRIYAKLTKVSILPEEEAHRQVDPTQVKHIICSHIHADHVGGLRDFPDATCWAAEECLAQFDRLPNWRSWARGVLKSLIIGKCLLSRLILAIGHKPHQAIFWLSGRHRFCNQLVVVVSLFLIFRVLR